MKYVDQIKEATEYLRGELPSIPKIAIVLGSGFSAITNMADLSIAIHYNQIPHFPVSTVKGHLGQLLHGTISGIPVLMMQGRFHYYEGHSMKDVTFPIRVFSMLGIQQIILTNSSGGIRHNFEPGDLVIVSDHINLSFTNPLIGKNLTGFGTRFPDTSTTYTPSLIQLAKDVCQGLNLMVHEGTYCFTTGPNYETPAEIRMMKAIGADLVGMSTVPEALVAVHSGLQVFCLSFVSNFAAGLQDEILSHDDVLQRFEEKKTMVMQFFDQFIQGSHEQLA